MTKYTVLVIGCLALMAGPALSQEVVIDGFPVGVGGDVNQDIFREYHSDLKAVADTLHKYPLARAIVTGGADGERYRQNHDAKNPGLALGRAHVLRSLLVNEFDVDSAQIVIRTHHVKTRGARFRFASVRIARELSELEARLDTVENRPPVEKHFIETKEVASDPIESLGLQFGAGLSSSPFGVIPIVASAVTWKRVVYVEGIVGHTFWNNKFQFDGLDLDTKRRLIGGYVIIRPYENLPVGVVGGWVRTEEIAQDYYEYTRLSEGLVLGLRASPLEFLSITGAYNPSKRRVASDQISGAENDQFMISVMAHILFGGEK
ncbi:MAG: hypothetical protein JSU65_12770 [Candidatus Zixiibacteriota bacterium]|nr:MAG: hypothetical protein JSU65_12770 [candidate division Zixibacteria bacterium]